MTNRPARTRGFTVALIGADGSGKTTLGRTLERSFPSPVKYLYMSANLEASNALLPTTRLVRWWKRRRGHTLRAGLPRPAEAEHGPRSSAGSLLREIRALLGLSNRLAEEWFRQGVAWYHTRRGAIVVFDRHFYSDYYAHDIMPIDRRSWARRVHGWMLKRVYPRPDLIVLLDAPARVLWERKPEGSLEAVERRREEYLRFVETAGPVAVVDASCSEELVAGQVTSLIRGRQEELRSGPRPRTRC